LGIKRPPLIFQKADELVNKIEKGDPKGERNLMVCRSMKRSWHATKCYMKRRRRLLFNLSLTS
jgi:hypothetical protein